MTILLVTNNIAQNATNSNDKPISTNVIKSDAQKHQYDPYRLFYGEWVIDEVLEKNIRVGADKGYEELIGIKIYYGKNIFKNDFNVSSNNPEYVISLIPCDTNPSYQFFSDMDINSWIPGSKYFTFVQVLNLSEQTGKYGIDYKYVGREFVVKDDNTLILYDHNCFYKMSRTTSTRSGDEMFELMYQERW